MSERIIVQIYTGRSIGLRDIFRRYLPASPHHPWNQRYEFRINEHAENADYLVMAFQPPTFPVKVRVLKENIIYLHGEPHGLDASIVRGYIRKFDTVIPPHPIKGSKRAVTFCGAAMLWGLEKSYDELAVEPAPCKTKMLSVICSSKTRIAGHRKRLAFVRVLKEHFGDAIDIYGKGINPFSNKWDVIAPYKYHIVLENSSEPHYWTEKLNDAYLAMSYPFYWGAPNISDYFPSDSLTTIDIDNPKQAIETIEQGMANSLYERGIASREKAKDKIINEYSLFAMLDKIITEKEAERLQHSSYQQAHTLFVHSPRRHKMIRKCHKKLRKMSGMFRDLAVGVRKNSI